MRTLRKRMENMFTSDQFTYKQLRGMFLTLAADQLFLSLINMLSTAMVSSIGEAAIAAVSLVSTINMIVIVIYSSLATGGSIVIARAKGSGDNNSIREAIGETTALCAIASIPISLILICFSKQIIMLLYPTAEPLLQEYGATYTRLMGISFIPFSLYSALFNSFRGLGDTRSSLLLTVVINSVHFVGCLVFINVLHLGVAGAGLSFIVARIIGSTLAVLWAVVFHNEYGVRVKHFFRLSKKTFSSIVGLGAPIALENLMMQGGMLIVQVYLARLTTSELAAHAVANSIQQQCITIGNALNALVSTVCGQCYGAKNYEQLRRYAKNFVRAGRVMLLLIAALLGSLLPLLLKLYSATDQGIPIILRSLSIAGISLPLFWCDSYVIVMALRSAGDTVFTSGLAVVALAFGRCAVGYLLTIVLGLGVPGVWIATALEWALRAAVLRIRLRGTRWLHLKPQAAEAA